MKTYRLFLILGLAASLLPAQNKIELSAPSVILRGIPFDMTAVGISPDSVALFVGGNAVDIGAVEVTGQGISLTDVVIDDLGELELVLSSTGGEASTEVYAIPGFTSILPPLIAIVLAFVTKQVLLSLFCGIWLGAVFTLGGYNPFLGFIHTVDSYLLRAITDKDHMSIVLFTMTLGGMVGIVARMGGTRGIVNALARYAKDRKRGQLATWLMGLLIFFDDYSNSLLVGNTMRPFTDKLKISREKLSYLVDSTSAPIASLALMSTWIGFELGLINASFETLNIDGNAYFTFLASIPYSFYSILALLSVGIIAYSGRDFGAMYEAEKRSLTEGKVLRDGATPLLDKELANLLPPEGVVSHWASAMLPILTMLLTLIVGLYIDGTAKLGGTDFSFREIIGEADSFKVLIWAAFGGTTVAGIYAVGRRILTIGQTVDAFLVGFKAMVVGIIILTLARSLQLVAADIHTADYIFFITRDILNPRFLPAITFVIAAVTSFSTGTSWGTMAILVPLVVPLAYTIPLELGLAAPVQEAIFLGSVGAILSGAIFGDHCSPISDTTVMSSIASGADHIDHVRTQLPYGLAVAAITLVFGYIPAGFGFNPWISNLLALVVTVLLIYKFGKSLTKYEKA